MKELPETASTPLEREVPELHGRDETELEESDLEAVAGGVTWHKQPDERTDGLWKDSADV